MPYLTAKYRSAFLLFGHLILLLLILCLTSFLLAWKQSVLSAISSSYLISPSLEAERPERDLQLGTAADPQAAGRVNSVVPRKGIELNQVVLTKTQTLNQVILSNTDTESSRSGQH